MLDLFLNYKQYYITGIGNTLILSFFSVIFGLSIGILIGLVKTSKSKILNIIGGIYIEILRGTPLIVQIFIVYYSFSNMGMFAAGILALSINSSAYTAEIIRAGIQGVDKGQMEAARSLGMTHGMAMKEIILPQAIKNILPALANEFIVVIKESAVVSVIGIAELMRQANIVSSITYTGAKPLYIAAVIYFLMTFPLSKAVGMFERRLKESD